MGKKFLSLILCLVMTFGIISVGKLNTFAVSYSYNKSTNTLTIYGSGKTDQNQILTAMNKQTEVVNVIIEDGVTEIDIATFKGFTGLKNITIADSVTSIGALAFIGCTSLKSITIPNSVTSIGRLAFSGCTSLKSVIIGDGVTSIREKAFGGCTGLTDLTIGSSVTTIDQYAFSDCENLTSIVLPASLTSIASGTFSGCKSLKEVIVDSNNKNFCNVDGILFSKNLTELVLYPADKSETLYLIPDRVTSIGDYAFSNCKNLITITIPDSVTSIGEYAFSDCKNLINITIPDGIISISNGTFNNCISLTEIIVPSSLETVYKYAFDGCSKLNDVYYRGTKSQCNSVLTEYNNTPFINATEHFYCDNNKHTFSDGACKKCWFICDHSESTSKPTCESSANCSVCSSEIKALGHKGGKADCHTLAICEVCGTGYGEVDLSNHTGEETWLTTATTHEKMWNCCDTVTVDETNHNWVNGKCVDCGYECKHPNLPADDGNCTTEVKCAICEKITSVAKESHTWGSWKSNGDGTHTCKCTVTGCTQEKTEICSGGKATCKELAVCDDCKQSYGEVDLTNHTGGTEIKNAVAATCTKEGYTGDTYCLGCKNQISSGSVTAELNHNYVNYTYNNDATTSKDGTETGICSRCSAKDTRTKAGTMIKPVINVASRTVDYRSKVTIKATASGVDSKYKLAIYVGNNRVATGSNTEVTYNAGETKGDINYTVKVVDANNTIAKDASGNEISKGGKVSCNSGFFKKLVAFFKGLFNKLPTVIIKP